MKPFLSVCIPTYNRDSLLKEAIDSILSQNCNDYIEIVVSDNASSDKTEEMMSDICNKNSNVKYFRIEENKGPDFNFLNAVNLASGEYCWLLGSDDLADQDSISKILSSLENNNCDILLFNSIDCEFDMTPRFKRSLLAKEVASRAFDFSNDEELTFYVSKGQSLGALLSYISSIVFKRASWQKVDFYESYIGSGFIHTFILLSIVAKGAKLKYLTDALVFQRGDNDSAMDPSSNGFSRIMIEFHAYEKFADTFFSTSVVVKSLFFRVFRGERPWWRFLKYFSLTPDEWYVIHTNMRKFEYTALSILIISGLMKFPFIPKMIYSQFKFAKSLYYKSKGSLGSSRALLQRGTGKVG
jgi:abequosyltransferase